MRRLTSVIPVSQKKAERELLLVKQLHLYNLSLQTHNKVRTITRIPRIRQPKVRKARVRTGMASSGGPCEAETVGHLTEASRIGLEVPTEARSSLASAPDGRVSQCRLFNLSTLSVLRQNEATSRIYLKDLLRGLIEIICSTC